MLLSELIRKKDNGDLYVSARELHKWLGFKKRYSDWNKQILSNPKFKFKENVDFSHGHFEVTIGKGNKRVEKDKLMTLRMASHIAMSTLLDKGIEARDYFYNAEQELATQRENNLKAFAQLFKHANKLKFTKEELYPILDLLGIKKSERRNIHDTIKRKLIGKYENVTLIDDFSSESFKRDYTEFALKEIKMNEDIVNDFVQLSFDNL